MKTKAISHLNFLNSSESGKSDSFLLSVFCILASLGLPLLLFVTLSEYASLALPVLIGGVSVAMLTRLARSFRAVFGYLLILIAMLFLAGVPLLVGLFASFSTAAVIFAVLWMKKPSPVLFLLPVLSYAAAFALTLSPFRALFALLPYPLAFVLAIAFRKRTPRVSAICGGTFAVLLPMAVLFLLFILMNAGSFSLGFLREIFDALRDRITQLLLAAAAEFETLGATLQVNFEANIPFMVESIFNYLPAVAIILGMLLSFFTHMLTLNVLLSLGLRKEESMPMMAFDMSLASAVVFLLSLILGGVLSAEGSEFFGVAANNLFLILIPGMVLTAFGALKLLVSAKGPSCFGSLLYIGALILLFRYPTYGVLVASLAGAGFLIVEHAARALHHKRS